MDDLHLPPGPGLPGGLTIPAAELIEQFSHASGPGGQGVNTSDTRVQLRFDIGTTVSLTDSQRAFVLKRLAPRLAGTVLMISAAEHRAQRRNRVAARERLAAVLREALAPEISRRATKPTRGSNRRRLEAKRVRSETKQQRRRPGLD